MTLVQTLITTQIIVDSLEAYPGGNWGGTEMFISPLEFLDGYFTGNFLNWGGSINVNSINSFDGPAYSGYTTNWLATPEMGALNAFQNAAYAGYTTNFGGNIVSTNPDLGVIDFDSVKDYPKDQFIYYKLKGYNPNTMSYETWIEKENITARPELFDPGAHPPTYDKGVVNLIAPSGAALVNITIVARWIQ